MHLIDTKKLSCKIGLFLGVIHIALFIYIVFQVNFSSEPNPSLYWLVFLYIDFPISLLSYGILNGYASVAPYIPTFLNKLFNFLFPILLFGVMGTIWYIMLPILISNAGKKIFKKK